MSFSAKCATVQTCPGHDKPMQKEFQNKISKTKWASANRPEQSEYQPTLVAYSSAVVAHTFIVGS